jgi:hypothetical protein
VLVINVKNDKSILSEDDLIYIDGIQPIEQIFNEILQKLEEFRKNNAKMI